MQHATAILTHLPVGRTTAVVGLQPFIGLTFAYALAREPAAKAAAVTGSSGRRG